MINNYITIALRQLDKYRFYTIINVFGLTIGIGACLLIFLFVRYELSFDRFHENHDRIVRVDWELYFGDRLTYNAAVTPPMAEAFVREFPEVEAAARLRYAGSYQFKRTVDNLVEPKVVWADNDLFRVFTFPFVAGNPAHALTEPNTMVISEKFASRLFPGESPLGKTLIKDNTTLYTITGVMKDIPDNSHFHYDIFLSMEGLDEAKSGNWIGGPFNTYVLLRPGASAADFEKKLPTIVTSYVMPHAASVLGDSFVDEFKRESSNRLTLRVMPLTDIHLYSHLRNELEGNSDIKYVYVFSVIAVFILAIACINFMNLATARSAKRAREVGVRKTMGSTRAHLTIQFLVESIILSLFSFLLALAVTEFTLPVFNSITGLHLSVPYQSPLLITGLIAVAILVGIAAGLYPGFVLSAFKPVEVLKGKMPRGDASVFLKSGLVVFQFTISIFLTIATFAVYKQVEFMKQVDLGFEEEQIIRMADVHISGNVLYNFRDEMLTHPLFKSATITSYFPGPGSARQTPLIWRFGSVPVPENSINIEKWSVDHQYITTMGMQIVKGRDFSVEFPSDSTAVIINEATAQQLGLGDDPIGSKLSLFYQAPDGTQDPNRLEVYTIIGVVRDFNFESLRQGVTPLGLFLGDSRSFIAFRYDAGKTQEAIDVLRTIWNKMAPGQPFNYSFMDENFQRMFETERKLGKLFVMFTGLAIAIACLGLFALTSYTAEQRRKEIGIRKVLGASVNQLTLLLTASFGRLILISFLLASGLAALGIRWYLEQYAYRTEIGTLLYVQSGVLAFGLAILTMGYQCLKAARTNPAESLKHE